MSAEELVKRLQCLRCGTREDLTLSAYSKRYKYKTGGAPVYTVHKGTDILKTPVCHNCLHKIKKWRLYRYLTIGLLILVEVLLYPVFSSSFAFFLRYMLGLSIYAGLIFASIIIFLLANINNPRRYVKFSGHIPYVRPIKSDKWVSFKNWAEVTIEGNVIQPHKKEPINPLVWKFPLIGGIICLISILTPTQIILYNDGVLRLDWIPLLTFYNEFETLGHQFVPVFIFQIIPLSLSTTKILSILTYIIILIGSFIIINKAYLLKRAGHSIISITNMHLVIGVILIIFISIFLFQNIDDSTSTSILSAGIYGVFVGGFITLLGPILQYIKMVR